MRIIFQVLKYKNVKNWYFEDWCIEILCILRKIDTLISKDN